MSINKNDMKAARLACSGFISPELINDRPIMRYISFCNLMDIFVHKRLTLTWAFDLKDTLEGCISEKQARKQTAKNFSVPEELGPVGYSVRPFQIRKRNTHINSWCQNPNEKLEMWNRYIPSHNGVAIYSTTSILTDIVENNLFSGGSKLDWEWIPVEYVELSDEYPEIDFNNMFNFKSKKDFYFEEEIRLVASNPEEFGKEIKITTASRSEDLNEEVFQKLSRKERISLPVDPNKLIQQIIISPGNGKKFHEDVVNLCNSNNFRNAVVQSSWSYRR